MYCFHACGAISDDLMANIAFFESITPYWVDFHNHLSDLGFEIWYMYPSIYSYDSAALVRDLRFTPHWALKPGKNTWRMGELRRIVRECSPEIVITPEFSLLTLQLLLLRKMMHASFKVVVRTDDSIRHIKYPNSRLHGLALKAMSSHVDNFILCDSRTADWFRDRYGAGIFLPILSDEARWGEALGAASDVADGLKSELSVGDRCMLTYVGRLSDEKNIPLIFRALEKVRVPEKYVLAIVGDGPLKESVASMAEQCPVRTVLLGRRSGNDLYAVYRIADVLILPSTREPFGAVTGEALESGCLALVSSYAGSSCLVEDGVNGMTFSPEDEDALAGCIEWACGHRPEGNFPRPSRLLRPYNEYLEELDRYIYANRLQ